MLHPNAKVISVGTLLPAGTAALAQQLAQARQQNAAMAGRYGQQPQKPVREGARLRTEFARQGSVVGEMLMAVLECRRATF